MGRWDDKKDEKWNKAGRKFSDVCYKYTPRPIAKGFGWWSRKMRKYIITLTFKQFVFAIISVIITGWLLKEIGVPYEFRIWLIFVILFLGFCVDRDDDDDPDDEPPKDDGGIIVKTYSSRQNT